MTDTPQPEAPKRKRGRPRKHPLPEPVVDVEQLLSQEQKATASESAAQEPDVAVQEQPFTEGTAVEMLSEVPEAPAPEEPLSEEAASEPTEEPSSGQGLLEQPSMEETAAEAAPEAVEVLAPEEPASEEAASEPIEEPSFEPGLLEQPSMEGTATEEAAPEAVEALALQDPAPEETVTEPPSGPTGGTPSEQTEDVSPEAEEKPVAPSEGDSEEEFALKYDMDSGKRYVDAISQKTNFEKMLEELSRISQDMLSWEVEKFANKYTKRYQGEGDAAEAASRKFEAFLGGFITNAAMELYDRGYQEAAFQRLEQTRSILEAKKKLENEVESIKARQEEDTIDLSDMLGLFGDGD